MKRLLHFCLCLFILVLSLGTAGAVPGDLPLPPAPMEGETSGDIIFRTKYTGERVKLRWLLKDKSLDHTYVIFRAPARAPKDRTRIAELKPMDFDTAKALLSPTDPAALKLIFPRETAINRAEYNASLGQTANRLNLLAYLSILNPRVAHVLGQSFEDRPPTTEKAWFYTLEVHNAQGAPRQATRGMVTRRAHMAPGPGPVTAHRFDWGVGLKWEGYDAYVGFHIFRSVLFDGPYTQITDHPIQVQAARNPDGTVDLAPYFYSDTAALEQGGYYKVQGLDFFGDAGPLSPAAEETVKTDPRPAPLARPRIKAGETRIEISWNPHTDDDIVGYNLYRSFNYNKTGEKLNTAPLTRTRFTDTEVIMDTPHFYAVTAVDQSGYESLPSLAGQGIPKDSTPPPVPQIPQGRLAPPPASPTVSPGKTGEPLVEITLSWPSVTARDLLGYRIYRTQTPDNRDWALLGQVSPDLTGYTDRLSPHLSRYPFYYRITSLDTHYNESAPGPALEIQLPDVTPPRAPAIAHSRAAKGRVSLVWTPVSAHDLAGYRVYRKLGEEKKMLAQLPPAHTAFQDPHAPQGLAVAYGVTALDRAGNESLVSAWSHFQLRDSRPPKLTDFHLKPVPQGMAVTLTSPDTDLAGFDLLRSRNGRDFAPCNSRRIQGMTYTDTGVLPGKRYFYQVRLWDRDGNTTMSPVRDMRMPRQ